MQKHLQYSGEKKTSSGLIQLNYNLHNYTIPPGWVGGKSVLPGQRALGSSSAMHLIIQ